jgi:predicted negative regulator of RcsB-dependent stress response
MQEVVDRADASMKGVAQFALAQLQAKHGGASKAIDTLTQLYNSGNYPKSAVAFDLAGLYEADGKQKQAEEYYGKVITESPDSRFRQDSEAALKRMGATIPTPPAPVPAKK